MSKQTVPFEAEVSRLLDIVVNALYSDKEIFLRELISNAADACDRRRYEALQDDGLGPGTDGFAIDVIPDKEAGTLTVADNGIGMNGEEMRANLGTIARSGTEAFLSAMEESARGEVSLIGRFGVGFYAAFMVADRVEVVSRRLGEEAVWRWRSEGKGGFEIEEADAADQPAPGTRIVLTIKKGDDAYLDPARLKAIIRKYSDHIPVPIRVHDGGESETANRASALWTRPKSEISEDDYREFFHHVGQAPGDPWLTLHWKAEGMIEYAALLFIPEERPFDIFHPDRRHRVKLYVKRVFITDDCRELVPEYLRFLTGVIDSEDLQLNISREMLQKNPVLTKIRNGVTKRVLGDLKKKADEAPEDYARFWDAFGAVLKEGLYAETGETRDQILALARFRSTAGEDLVSLDQYVERMKPGQKAIYTIAGEDIDQLRRSPQLEGFVDKGVEVLLLADPIDEFWAPAIGQYRDFPIRSVTRGAADLDEIGETADKAEDETAETETDDTAVDALVARLKLALDGTVKDVRASKRLRDSAVCLVADEGDLDINLEKLLHRHGQITTRAPRVLEINPKHPTIKALAGMTDGGESAPAIEDCARLLYDQALIMEGESVPDPQAFARRLGEMMARGLKA